MASYQRLLLTRQNPLDALYAAVAEAEAANGAASTAATRIQALARMCIARRRYRGVLRAVVDVQRCFRGYRGRMAFLGARVDAAAKRRDAVFDYYATVLQRHFRGYWARKWRGDFHRRKAYLITVEQRSLAVVAEAEAQRQAQEVTDAGATLAADRRTFRAAAANSHHLLSTATRSGVFRPAAAASAVDTQFGTNVEDELRDAAAGAFKRSKFRADVMPPAKRGIKPGPAFNPRDAAAASQAASAGPTKGAAMAASGVRSLTATLRGAPQVTSSIDGAPYSRAVQAARPFDAVDEGAKLQRAVERRLAAAVHPQGFAPGRRAPQPPACPPLLHGPPAPRDEFSGGSRRSKGNTM